MEDPDKIRAQFEAEEEAVASQSAELISPITTIHIDVTARGQRFEGDFIYKVPTIADQVKIGRMKTQYLPQGGAADVNAASLVEQICYLEITLQDPRPGWWQPFKMYDVAPISVLYMEALAYERRFHGEVLPAGAAAGSDEQGAEDGGRDAVVGEAPVGRKVRPASERRETLVANGPRSR